ncbi:FAD-binding oxidoreductase [Citrifermentans bremense]|uniref:FAD-binding oxidoreductase n=1 Tax=Citrifermentans bremense TaxID=60035 RepID=UPI0004234A46|nr:FAD-binding oxidoreductase [Citrifermentans bremense]
MSSFIALPKGIKEETFAKAIREYRSLLGENRVRTDAAALQQYLANTVAPSAAPNRPSAVLYPGSESDVQGVVRIANAYKTPLWTYYGGENRGYGSAAPATDGQIVLDMRGMKKVIEVDRELGYCLVEPGVTYDELQRYLAKNKIDLWLDTPAPAAGVSIAGNILERGTGYTPYSESFLFSCGMEVVLGDGSLIRTGMGGIPRTTSWQVFKWGFGPYVDGLFSQGNSGIVTKVGAWLMPPPPPGGYKPFCIRFPSTDMVQHIVKPLMFLRETQIVPNACALVNAGWEAAAVAQGKKKGYVNSGKGTLATRKVMDGYGVGAWNLYGAVYGSPEQVELNWKYVFGTFTKAFGNKIKIITEKEAKGDPAFQYRAQLMKGGVTSNDPLDSWRPGGGSMRFQPTAAARPGEIAQQVKLATEIVNRHGFDYLSELVFFWRDARHVIDLRFNRADAAEARRAHQCYDELTRSFSKRGWGINRTTPAFMNQVADSYGPAMRRFNRTVKKALDPNNIVAPGKSGITLA